MLGVDHVQEPPSSYRELLDYAKAFPNRITYPKPPEFHGTGFLKSLLSELTKQDQRLFEPVEEAHFQQLTQPLWDYLDALHPVAWRAGKQFPSGVAQMTQLLDDGRLDLALTFNPGSVYAAQELGNLAETTQVYAFEHGALSNVHFLAIPWNSAVKPAAQVTINFLMSPLAQSRKADPKIWGDPSVLASQHLSEYLHHSQEFQSTPELHWSWQTALEKEWLKRYGH